MALALRFSQRRRLVILVLCLLLGLYIYATGGVAVLLVRINQLPIEVDRRVQWWDWKDTEEEIFCRARHELPEGKAPIPNVVHFIYIAKEGKRADLSYAHFLAIKAAVIRMNAREIKVHTYDFNTENEWWKQIKRHVTHVVHERDEFHGPHGLPMSRLQIPHQADIMRMAILKQEGGIYLDTDAYTLKPFTDLLTNQRDTIMGHEGGNRYGLCNAVIVSRPNSDFLRMWEETYRTFDPNAWNDHSVRMPKRLQVQYPRLICPLSPTAFFWPTWAKAHLQYMHSPITPEETDELRSDIKAYGGAMYENQLAFHAAGSGDWLHNITAEHIQAKDTRFNVLIREIAAASI